MKKAVAMILLFALCAGCAAEKADTAEIDSFEGCVSAGYPVVESYPGQCRTPDGRTFTEDAGNLSEEGPAPRLTLEEAVEIAQNSACAKEGPLRDTHVYNPNSKTWWIDLDVEKEGCSPACVVEEETRRAEVNWRCTGLLPP